MEIIYTMLLEAGKGLTFILVSLAFLVSALILFRPLWAQALNVQFNKFFSTEPLAKSMDINFPTTDKIIKHRFLLGTVFVLGSGFILWYLTGPFHTSSFITYLVGATNPDDYFLLEMGLKIVQGLMVFVALVGLITGLTALVQPEGLKSFAYKMDQTIATDGSLQTLDQSYSTVDDWVWQHHIVVGLVLFVGSSGLLAVCIKMLIN